MMTYFTSLGTSLRSLLLGLWGLLLFLLPLLCVLLLALVVVLVVATLRATRLQPAAAPAWEPAPVDPERAARYGQGLSVLVQQETVSSRYQPERDKFLAFHQVLEAQFPLLHKTCEKHVFHGSLLFRWPGKSAKDPILFMSHHDVVEATGDWQHPAFGGEIVDGAVWGRGTVDTKASLFCFLTAAQELMAEGYVPPCDVYLASSCTEEWSGEGAPLTAQYLKEQGVHLSLLLDEGGMIMEEPMAGVKGRYAMVGVVEKGYGDVKFIARGKGGHASAPGKNTPIARLAKFVTRVEGKKPFRVEFSPTANEMFRRMAPNMTFPMKLIFGNLSLFAPLLKKLMPAISPLGAAMLQTTCAFTTQQGATGLNVLPQEAFVTANMRFIQHQGTDESISIMKKLAAKYDLETQVIYSDYPCPVVDFKGKAFQRVEGTIQALFPGVTVSPYIMTGGTDAKFYREVCDNCIRFAPLEINKQQYSSIHGLDENLDCAVLPAGVDFYKAIVKSCETAGK